MSQPDPRFPNQHRGVGGGGADTGDPFDPLVGWGSDTVGGLGNGGDNVRVPGRGFYDGSLHGDSRDINHLSEVTFRIFNIPRELPDLARDPWKPEAFKREFAHPSGKTFDKLSRDFGMTTTACCWKPNL